MQARGARSRRPRIPRIGDMRVTSANPVARTAAAASTFNPGRALRSAELSRLAYQDEATIRRELAARGFDLSTFTFIDAPGGDVQGFVVKAPGGAAFAAFRGTASPMDA